MRTLGLLRLFPILVVVAACSDDTLSIFFDIPPPTPEELAAQAAEEQAAMARSAPTAAPEEEGEPPAIETVSVWDQALEMLPKDDLDEPDWMAALRDGTIRPRASVAGPGQPDAKVFKWNFFFPGPDPSFDAYFPHSSHTQWVGCESCHPKVFQYRELEVTMDKLFEGEFCGVCHGVVAFSLDACTRCHTKME